jgi:hypothetical protein
MLSPHLTDPLEDGLTAKLEDEAAAWRRRRSARTDQSSTAGVKVVRIAGRTKRVTSEPVEANGVKPHETAP